MGDEADAMWDAEMIQEGYEAFQPELSERKPKRRRPRKQPKRDIGAPTHD